MRLQIYLGLFAIALKFTRVVECLTQKEIDAFVARVHTEQNSGLQGWVSATANSADEITLTSNGIPDHETAEFGDGGTGRNDVEGQSYSFVIPKNPSVTQSTTCLPQGPIGMAINGVAIFNPFTSGCCDAGELESFDVCNGHPSPQNAYHYHLAPKCLFDVICNKASTLIGVAFDGFPIYGPIDEDGTQLAKGDLDACGGKFTGSEYRYHVINEFPYIIGCYTGTVIDSGVLRRIGSECTCTEPEDPCTQFGGRKRSLLSTLWRKKRQTNLFECEDETDEIPATTTTTTRTRSARRRQRPGRRG